MSGVRKGIGDLDKVAALEPGKCYQNPEGLWGAVVGGDGVLSDDGQGLPDIELVKSFRTSNIVKHIGLKMK